MSRWRTLYAWQKAVVWNCLHETLLNYLCRADPLDYSRTSRDSSMVPATRGEEMGPNPTDRGKSSTNHHLVVDWQGIPRSITQSAANVHASKMLEAALEAISPIRRPRGRPRRRPSKLHADKACDFGFCRKALRARHIQAQIAWRGTESSKRLRRHPWVAELT